MPSSRVRNTRLARNSKTGGNRSGEQQGLPSTNGRRSRRSMYNKILSRTSRGRGALAALVAAATAAATALISDTNFINVLTNIGISDTTGITSALNVSAPNQFGQTYSGTTTIPNTTYSDLTSDHKAQLIEHIKTSYSDKLHVSKDSILVTLSSGSVIVDVKVYQNGLLATAAVTKEAADKVAADKAAADKAAADKAAALLLVPYSPGITFDATSGEVYLLGVASGTPQQITIVFKTQADVASVFGQIDGNFKIKQGKLAVVDEDGDTVKFPYYVDYLSIGPMTVDFKATLSTFSTTKDLVSEQKTLIFTFATRDGQTNVNLTGIKDKISKVTYKGADIPFHVRP